MSSYAQVSAADSLKKVLVQTKENTTQRVDVLNDIGWELKETHPREAIDFLNQAAQIAMQLNYQKGEAQAYNNRGVLENMHNNLDVAISYFQKALAIRTTLDDKKGIASLYNNIGNVYEDKRQYVEALAAYKKSLAINIAAKEEKKIARVRYNISLLHERMGNYQEAQDELLEYLKIIEKQNNKEDLAKAYTILGHLKSEMGFLPDAQIQYEKALALCKTVGDELPYAEALLNLGNNISDQKKINEALQLYQQALAIYEKNDFPEGKANTYHNIGVAYKDLEQYNTALDFLQKALKIRITLDDKRGIMETYNGIGDVKRRQHDGKAALQYAQQYFAIANDIKDEKFVQKGYKDLSLAYEMLGEYKKALAYRIKYDELRYSRLNESKLQDFQRREVAYGDFKKQLEIERQERQIHQDRVLRNSLIGAILAFVMISLLLYNRYQVKNQTAKALAEKNEIIDIERKRSDELLLNILPETVAQELKLKGKAEARLYENVTVLFTDFKSFTQVAEQLSAAELVQELDTCFKAFDDICDEFGIEKIKTIGDAYMCVSGLPIYDANHALNATKAALKMLGFMQSYNTKRHIEGKPIFEMRVGLHTGSVVAGVVGSRKFAFDIWGDTVNIAARMEAAALVGTVNISQSVYELIKNAFICEPRGNIAVKNKGEIEMYYINGL